MIKFHKPPFKLKEFKIEVTHRCNLNCIHCSSDATPINPLEISENDCLRILEESSEIGVCKIAFSGGEPLIWSGIEKAVEKAVCLNMEVTIYTSGNIGNLSKKIKQLKALGLTKCVFSIFGELQLTHERITRKHGSFKKTLEAISAANTAGIKTELHFVPMSANYQELDGIAQLGKKLGVSCISILRFVPQGRGQLLQKQVLSKEQNLKLKHIVTNLRNNGIEIRTGSPYNFLMLSNQPKCCSGIDRLIIGPDLRIYPCDAFKQIKAEELCGTVEFSSLDEASLQECWAKSPFLEATREYLTSPFAKSCASCLALEKCLSGCLAQKVINHSSFIKLPDPDCLLGTK